jgi:HNH endonuclease
MTEGMDMRRNKPPAKSGNLEKILAEARRKRELRSVDYRDRALKIFPHICGRCGREFEGKKLQELTVHHMDHNHDNNPPDGSNWELLCTYCHDMEHARYVDEENDYDETSGGGGDSSSTYKPFANLKDLLEDKS